MPCIIAFLVFSILGIFSATHRKLAREAFDCVFRRLTLKPCDTGFDTKIKASILGKLISRSPKLAKLVNRHFEALAWLFMISMTVSTVYFFYGLANYYRTGSCYGLNQSGFCVFDPAGEHNQFSGLPSGECSLHPPTEADLSIEYVNQSVFPTQDNQSERNIFFVGCYTCQYTRDAYPLIQSLRREYSSNYTFAHLPTKIETDFLSAYGYCVAQEDKELYWQFNDYLFEIDAHEATSESHVRDYLERQGIDLNSFDQCLESEETETALNQQLMELSKIGLYGTPTIFFDETPAVGPKPYRVYRRLLLNSWF